MSKKILWLLLILPLSVAADHGDKTRATREPVPDVQPARPEAMKPVQRPPEPPAAKPTRQLQAEQAKKPVLVVMKPDLVVEVADPVSPGLPVMARVRNVGPVATPVGFTVVSNAESLCEAGKLKSPVSVHPADGEQTVEPIPAGSFRYVAIRPKEQVWSGGGCYLRVTVRADTWSIVAESNEMNNRGSAHFCPSGQSCY